MTKVQVLKRKNAARGRKAGGKKIAVNGHTPHKPGHEDLQLAATEIRKHFLKMHFEAQSGHIGTGLSAIDLLTFIYKRKKNQADQFILSKGHGASALYAVLHYVGLLKEQDLQSYYKDATLLPAHPAARAFSDIPAATGSLGHGLPIATGMAFANKYFQQNGAQVICLLSDGECDEGSVWEAALFGSHHSLNNLTVIVDANGLQGFGETSEVLNLEPISKKWEAFNFEVREINGHDFSQMDSAFKPHPKKPLCIIARTVKGKGVSFMENKLEWHYLPMNEAQFHQATQELDAK